MKRKRRTNQLEATAAQVVKLSTKACPSWHREDIKVFEKALKEQIISLNLKELNHRIIKNNFILYTIENWKGCFPGAVIHRV